ncbi:MAG: thiol-disulfide oxidoreductase DCC family protein [Phycisphaerales bacterium]
MSAPMTLFYDGTCRFCVAGAKRLERLAPPGTLDCIDYHTPGALDRFPQITPERCESAMQLVTNGGHVYSGAGALVQVLAARRWFVWARWCYSIAPLRWALDCFYRVLARNRHRILGRTPADSCDSGTCRTR